MSTASKKSKRLESDDTIITPKRRKAVTIQAKLDIINCFESDQRMTDIARQYGVNRSTIATIIKDKDKILDYAKAGVSVRIVLLRATKETQPTHDAIAHLLRIWIDENVQRK